MPAALQNDLVERWYADMKSVEAVSRPWVQQFKNQEELYRALFKMKRVTSEAAFLKMNLDPRSPPGLLYKKMSEVALDMDSAWPSGDYNTVRDALNSEINWILKSKWETAIFSEEEETDRLLLTMAPMAIWECFGAPYFVALWNALRNKAPDSVFMFVYSGGGAGVCSSLGTGFTALHCVSFEDGIDASRCIVMSSSGDLGIFEPEEMSREHDYAFGKLVGLDSIVTAPRLLDVPEYRKADVVCYGAPSSRDNRSGVSTNIKWPWLSVLKRCVPDTDIINKIVKNNTRWSWGTNYFCKVTGEMNTAEMNMENVRNGVFAHDATLTAGMSGGPIYCNNQLVGIHQSWCETGRGPDCRYRAGKSLGLLLDFAERHVAARLAVGTAGYHDRTLL